MCRRDGTAPRPAAAVAATGWAFGSRSGLETVWSERHIFGSSARRRRSQVRPNAERRDTASPSSRPRTGIGPASTPRPVSPPSFFFPQPLAKLLLLRGGLLQSGNLPPETQPLEDLGRTSQSEYRNWPFPSDPRSLSSKTGGAESNLRQLLPQDRRKERAEAALGWPWAAAAAQLAACTAIL